MQKYNILLDYANTPQGIEPQRGYKRIKNFRFSVKVCIFVFIMIKEILTYKI